MDATIGSTSQQETVILVGDFPHITRSYQLKAGSLSEDHPGGLVMAQGPDAVVYPYNETYSFSIGTGDGAVVDFTGKLGCLVPGSVVITDGVEAFSDDGFGTLTGDGGGSGKVDYETGIFQVAFNAAPANEGNIVATVKNRMRGILAGLTYLDAESAAVCVRGPINRENILIGTDPASDAELLELDNLGVWPNG